MRHVRAQTTESVEDEHTVVDVGGDARRASAR
jgi:hypothetical protein